MAGDLDHIFFGKGAGSAKDSKENLVYSGAFPNDVSVVDGVGFCLARCGGSFSDGLKALVGYGEGLWSGDANH